MIEDSTTRNKRIAKNTLVLYFRTFITMLVGIYTGRIMLEALGIDNYGINNVVGGIVGFTSLITGTMAGASSRYITYALGEGNLDRMKTVFSTVSNVQIFMGIIGALFLEIIGVWFLNTTANIPSDRMMAANWVLQCSIINTFIGLAVVPYGATIMAHEHMSIYAYIALFECFTKLGICYLVLYWGGDKLILFSSLGVCLSIIYATFNVLYCIYHFNEARYRFSVDKKLLKEIASYSGWNLFGNTSWVFNTQGVSMLINVFFGVAYNAAMGVANTVNQAVQNFIGNFSTAFYPQITKLYADKSYSECYRLVNRGMKFTWLLSLLFIVPICIEANTLLSIWLVQVPPMASLFLRFAVFNSLALTFSSPLLTLIQATGNVKKYTIQACFYGCIIFPFTWIAYKLGAPIWAYFPVALIVRFTIPILRLHSLARLTTYQWRSYLKDALFPSILCLVLSFSLPLVITIFWNDCLLRFICMIPLCLLWTFLIEYKFGLSKGERIFVIDKVKRSINKLCKKNNPI